MAKAIGRQGILRIKLLGWQINSCFKINQPRNEKYIFFLLIFNSNFFFFLIDRYDVKVVCYKNKITVELDFRFFFLSTILFIVLDKCIGFIKDIRVLWERGFIDDIFSMHLRLSMLILLLNLIKYMSSLFFLFYKKFIFIFFLQFLFFLKLKNI